MEAQLHLPQASAPHKDHSSPQPDPEFTNCFVDAAWCMDRLRVLRVGMDFVGFKQSKDQGESGLP